MVCSIYYESCFNCHNKLYRDRKQRSLLDAFLVAVIQIH